jgi:hypothetical protein
MVSGREVLAVLHQSLPFIDCTQSIRISLANVIRSLLYHGFSTVSRPIASEEDHDRW